jgi:hypothetical protein
MKTYNSLIFRVAMVLLLVVSVNAQKPEKRNVSRLDKDYFIPNLLKEKQFS